MKKYIKAPILSTAFSESEKSAKNRFKNILSEKGKIGVIVVVILAILVVIAATFVSIKNKPQENITPTVSSGDIRKDDTSEKQLAVILDNISKWSLTKELEQYDTYGYAITDLDRNGRLEIITSHCDGTGLYSYNKYYEVNESLDGINELTTNLKDEDIQTYIMDATVKVFYDAIKNEYHYVFTNVNRNGAAEYNEAKYGVVLKDGKITQKLLASKDIIYKNGGEDIDIIIKNADGEELTDESYERYEYIHFKDYEYSLASIEWVMNGDGTKSELEKSYNNFKLGAPKVENDLNDEFALTDNDGNKIQLNDSIKTVKEGLISSKYNSSDGFHVREYSYANLYIRALLASYVDDYYIMQIETTSPKYKTKRGISVGDTLKKLKEAYPENLTRVQTDTKEIIWCYPYSDFISITFNITDEVISKIIIENKPC